MVKRGPGRPPKRRSGEEGTPTKRVSPRKQAMMEKQQQQQEEYQRREDETAAMAQQQGQQEQNDVFAQQDSQSGQLGNVGYDSNNPNMSNMGWDESAGNPTTPGGPASMGAPTPYRFAKSYIRKFLEDAQTVYVPNFRDEDEDDEYPNPASVGVTGNKEDEQMREDETIEEFEDRVLNKRAAHLNTVLRSRFLEGGHSKMRFSELPVRKVRKSIAQNFYSLLVLQKVMAVELEQGEQFTDEINISKGPNFESAIL